MSSNRAAWLAKYRKKTQRARKNTRRSRTVQNGFDLDVNVLAVRRPPAKKGVDTKKKVQASVIVTGVHKLVADARKLAQSSPDLAAKLPYEALDEHTIRIRVTAPAKTPENPDVKKPVTVADVLGSECQDPPSKFLLRDGMFLNVTYFAQGNVEDEFSLPSYMEATLNAFHINAFYKMTDAAWMFTEQCAAVLPKAASVLNQRHPVERLHAMVDLQTQAFRDPLHYDPPVPWRPNIVTLRLGEWAPEAMLPEQRPENPHQRVFLTSNTFMYADAGGTYEGLAKQVFTYKSEQDETQGKMFPIHRQEVLILQQPDAADDEVFEENQNVRIYLYSSACAESGIVHTKAWKAHELAAPMPFYATFEVGKKKNEKKPGEFKTSLYPIATAWPMRDYLGQHGVRVSRAWAEAHLQATAPPPNDANPVNQVDDANAYLRNVTDMQPGAREAFLAKISDVPASAPVTKADVDRWELYALASRLTYDPDTELEESAPVAPDAVGQPDTVLPADSTALPIAPANPRQEQYTLLAVRVLPPPDHALPVAPQLTSLLVPEALEEMADAPALDLATAAPVDEPMDVVAEAPSAGKRPAPTDEPAEAPPAKKAKTSAKKGKKSKK